MCNVVSETESMIPTTVNAIRHWTKFGWYCIVIKPLLVYDTSTGACDIFSIQSWRATRNESGAYSSSLVSNMCSIALGPSVFVCWALTSARLATSRELNGTIRLSGRNIPRIKPSLYVVAKKSGTADFFQLPTMLVRGCLQDLQTEAWFLLLGRFVWGRT